jgi:hypothetical protein
LRQFGEPPFVLSGQSAARAPDGVETFFMQVSSNDDQKKRRVRENIYFQVEAAGARIDFFFGNPDRFDIVSMVGITSAIN